MMARRETLNDLVGKGSDNLKSSRAVERMLIALETRWWVVGEGENPTFADNRQALHTKRAFAPFEFELVHSHPTVFGADRATAIDHESLTPSPTAHDDIAGFERE